MLSLVRSAAALTFALSFVAVPARAACDHPYFPMAKGQSWVYRASGIDVTEVVTKIEGDVVSLDVTTGADKTSRTTTVTETCNAEGIGSQTMHSADGKTDMKTLKHSGAEYGPASQMKIGGAWTYEDVTESLHGGMTVTSARKSTSKIVASEKVKVAAGEFEALKVESDVNVTTTMSGTNADKVPKSASAPRHYKSNAWIAKGVGLVKLQTLSEAGEANPASELVSFKK